MLVDAAAEYAQDAFFMVTHRGLYTPTRVPQGVQSVTGHFRATMEHVGLDGMTGEAFLVWIDDIVIKGRMPRKPLLNVVKVLQRLIKDIYAAAHVWTFFLTPITWWGNVSPRTACRISSRTLRTYS